MRSPKPEPALRAAVAADAPQLLGLARSAYAVYVERMGREPRPMRDDYAEVVAGWDVTVAEQEGLIVGLLVTGVSDEYGGFAIDNVAVAPALRGTGLGRRLLERGEQLGRAGGHSEVRLLTHETMRENLALYARIGYSEYLRSPAGDGSELVFMRKPLGPS
jgi:ribosomal protein S18 acetylase RimI-like enzyme